MGWDTRIGCTLGGRSRARRRRDLFRTQLWWDHLPSPEVLGRGGQQNHEEPLKCPHCSAPGLASTWHLLAECSAPTLVKTRTAAAYQLRKMVLDLIPHRQSERGDAGTMHSL